MINKIHAKRRAYVYDESKEARAKYEIERLFGNINYKKDDQLKDLLNKDDWIPLYNVNQFEGMKHIGLTPKEICSAVKHSTVVETRDTEFGYDIRRKK